MNRKTRNTILIFGIALAAGLMLIPFVGVQAQVFRWQNYSGVYATPTPGPDGATVLLTQISGAPGSDIEVHGYGFAVDSSASVHVNGVELGSIVADSNGEVRLALDTRAADLGRYEVEISQPDRLDSKPFFLVPNGELHTSTAATVFNVPAGIGELIGYFPFILGD